MSLSTAASGTSDTALTQSDVVTKKRIVSIDVMRGLVILLMAVDHVRERFFYHLNVSDPMDLEMTSPALFFTRMTAHLCAPTFVFLTGMAAWLYANPANNAPRSASSFLLKRGLFLVLIEVTLVNFSWFGNVDTSAARTVCITETRRKSIRFGTAVAVCCRGRIRAWRRLRHMRVLRHCGGNGVNLGSAGASLRSDRKPEESSI